MHLGDLDTSPDFTNNLLDKDYELTSREISFFQRVDQRGKPSSDLRGGMIKIVLATIPTDELLRWMMESGTNSLKNGSIYSLTLEGQKTNVINFHNAACLNLSIIHSGDGTSSTHTALELHAEEVSIGPRLHNIFKNNF